MPDQNPNPSRRRLLRIGLAGFLAAPTVPLVVAPAAANERLSEDAPEARALHYRHDAADVEHEAYVEGQNCANCQLYSDPDASKWGPCDAFGGRHVSASGWCNAWVERS